MEIDKPKSPTLTVPSCATKQFAGLISRCKTPARSAVSRPSIICKMASTASGTGRGTFAFDAIFQRSVGDHFHGDDRHPFDLFRAEDGDDVWMAHRRRELSFPKKPKAHLCRIDCLAEHFERNTTPGAPLFRFVNGAHAALAEQTKDAVIAKIKRLCNGPFAEQSRVSGGERPRDELARQAKLEQTFRAHPLQIAGAERRTAFKTFRGRAHNEEEGRVRSVPTENLGKGYEKTSPSALKRASLNQPSASKAGAGSSARSISSGKVNAVRSGSREFRSEEPSRGTPSAQTVHRRLDRSLAISKRWAIAVYPSAPCCLVNAGRSASKNDSLFASLNSLRTVARARSRMVTAQRRSKRRSGDK